MQPAKCKQRGYVESAGRNVLCGAPADLCVFACSDGWGFGEDRCGNCLPYEEARVTICARPTSMGPKKEKIMFKSTELEVWGWDFETDLIGPGAVAPPPICFSLASRMADGQLTSMVLADGDADFWPYIEKIIERLATGKLAVVGHHIHYDMSVIAVARPALLPGIFKAYERGAIFDTEVREKLLVLSTDGNLKYVEAPDGSTGVARYRLNDLTKKHLAKDRGAEKEDEDSWRKHYAQLKGRKAAEYPKEALQYVADDSTDALLIFEVQDTLVESPDGGPASVKTQEFQAGVAFALRLATIVGWPLDPLEFSIIENKMAAIVSEENLKLLIDAEILRKGIAPKPWGKPDDEGKSKMTKYVKPSIDTKKLHAYIENVCHNHGIDVRYTDPSKKYPTGQVSTKEEVIADLAVLDPLLDQYHERQKVQKIVNTELPRMRNPDGSMATRLHPVFDVLKETGRTSSYADKLFPSCGIQQIDPRVRGCYVADGPDANAPDGWVLLSVDISGAELVSWGWKCMKLFGRSTILDLLNAGGDAHAFLGAQIAYVQDQGFRSACDQNGAADRQARYDFFRSCKKSDNEGIAKFYKHFRKVAKPTGLGYPGGLGPKTFVTMARQAPHKMKFTLEEAQQLREVWITSYDEAKPYFDWITHNCQDARNPIIGYKDGRPIQGYAYRSPMGMYRAGTNFTGCCNGFGLQTPTAEGAKLAFFEVTRAAYDATYRSPLYGCKVLAFIHDEIVLMIPRDQWMHERALEVSRVMSHAVGSVFDGAIVRTEPALMLRWNKAAEPVYDAQGRLTIWEPKAA